MPDIFYKPVRILIGLGFPKDISSPLDAIVYLDSVQQSARDYSHTIASRACRAALTGEIEAETARGLFEAYATKQSILAPEMDEVVAARSVGPNTSVAF